MYKFKKFMRGILRLLVKILILDSILIGIIYLITINMGISFRTVMEIAAIILLVLAGGSFMGGRELANSVMHFNMFWSPSKNRTKMATDEIKSVRSDYGLLATAGIGGLIILIATIFI